MRVDVELPVMMMAQMEWDFSAPQPPYPLLVSVYFGDALITQLTPVRETRAGHGDDAAYFESEEKRIISETVAQWLKERLV